MVSLRCLLLLNPVLSNFFAVLMSFMKFLEVNANPIRICNSNICQNPKSK